MKARPERRPGWPCTHRCTEGAHAGLEALARRQAGLRTRALWREGRARRCVEDVLQPLTLLEDCGELPRLACVAIPGIVTPAAQLVDLRLEDALLLDVRRVQHRHRTGARPFLLLCEARTVLLQPLLQRRQLLQIGGDGGSGGILQLLLRLLERCNGLLHRRLSHSNRRVRVQLCHRRPPPSTVGAFAERGQGSSFDFCAVIELLLLLQPAPKTHQHMRLSSRDGSER